MTLNSPIGPVLDAIAAQRSGDARALNRLTRALRRHLPAQQVKASRRGIPFVHSRIVALRVVVADRVFRIDTTTGAPVCEIGEAVNGVASRHVAVPADRWARELGVALENLRARGLGTSLGPLQ